MKFKFVKHPHIPLRRYVWYKNICIGYIDQKIRENNDIDWAALRADKTKVLKGEDRWYSLFSSTAYPDVLVTGTHESKEEAARAILLKHLENAP